MSYKGSTKMQTHQTINSEQDLAEVMSNMKPIFEFVQKCHNSTEQQKLTYPTPEFKEKIDMVSLAKLTQDVREVTNLYPHFFLETTGLGKPFTLQYFPPESMTIQ